jgi:ketosteroid isomerase-like protein
MRRRIVEEEFVRLIAVLLLAALPVSAQSVEAELKPIINEMLAAVAPGDTAPWKKYLDDRMVYVSEANEVQTKEQLLADFRPLPKGLDGTLQVGDDFKVEQHGNVAIVVMTANERLDYHGQILNSQYRMTDTWQKSPDGWRLLARQVLAVLFDPPAIALPHDTLCAYNGTYRLTDDISTKITCTDSGLQSERTGRKAVMQKPEAKDVFFEPGQPRSRRMFQRDAKGNITGFADRREGLDIVWTKVAK